MELKSYFIDFLSDIRLTENQRKDCITGHKTLRDRLNSDPDLAPIIVSTFLQGSYRRATAVRPANGNRADVDVVVVTNLKESDYPNPHNAMEKFIPFLKRYYDGKFKVQNRSISIELSYVDLDLVITSAPSEAESKALRSSTVTDSKSLEEAADWRLVPSWIPLDQRGFYTPYVLEQRLEEASKEAEWKLSPLRIPDREAQSWEDTHPLAQMSFTTEKNRKCNGHYVNVVKALRWWKRINDRLPKYPKGYPLEHIIGLHCPDGIQSVAEGVVLSLENVVAAYRGFAAAKQTPCISDHGVSHDVYKRVSGSDFAKFFEVLEDAAQDARLAFDSDSKTDSVMHWKKLFGSKFPDAPVESDKASSVSLGPSILTARTSNTTVGGHRYA